MMDASACTILDQEGWCIRWAVSTYGCWGIKNLAPQLLMQLPYLMLDPVGLVLPAKGLAGFKEGGMQQSTTQFLYYYSLAYSTLGVLD